AARPIGDQGRPARAGILFSESELKVHRVRNGRGSVTFVPSSGNSGSVAGCRRGRGRPGTGARGAGVRVVGKPADGFHVRPGRGFGRRAVRPADAAGATGATGAIADIGAGGLGGPVG